MSGYYDDKNTFYIGEFDEGLEEILLKFNTATIKQSKIANGRINMLINSYGGNAAIAFHLVEAMEMAKRAGIEVRTVVTSAAYSAGSIVAVAGSIGQRYIAKDALHLVHYGYYDDGGNTTPTQNSRSRSVAEIFFKQIANHYSKYCNIPDLEHHMSDDNWYINASSAKKWNMADHYIDKYKI